MGNATSLSPKGGLEWNGIPDGSHALAEGNSALSSHDVRQDEGALCRHSAGRRQGEPTRPDCRGSTQLSLCFK